MFPELKSIQIRRNRLNLTQKELAGYVNVSQSLIAKLEAGKLEPSYSVACKIFRFFEEYNNFEEKLCKDLMTKKVFFVDVNDKIESAVKAMKNKGISQIPIKENNEVIGLISESNLYSLLEKGDNIDHIFSMRCGDVMGNSLPVLDERTPISYVLPLLKFYSGILLSSENKKKIVGILTKSNLF